MSSWCYLAVYLTVALGTWRPIATAVFAYYCRRLAGMSTADYRSRSVFTGLMLALFWPFTLAGWVLYQLGKLVPPLRTPAERARGSR